MESNPHPQAADPYAPPERWLKLRNGTTVNVAKMHYVPPQVVDEIEAFAVDGPSAASYGPKRGQDVARLRSAVILLVDELRATRMGASTWDALLDEAIERNQLEAATHQTEDVATLGSSEVVPTRACANVCEGC